MKRLLKNLLGPMIGIWGSIALSTQLVFAAVPAFACTSESGKYVSFCPAQGILSLWELPTAREIRRIETPFIAAAAISEQHGLVAIMQFPEISVWSIQTGERLWITQLSAGGVRPLGGTPDSDKESICFVPNRPYLVHKFDGGIYARNVLDGMISWKWTGNASGSQQSVSHGLIKASRDGARLYFPIGHRSAEIVCLGTTTRRVEGIFKPTGGDKMTRYGLFDADDDYLLEVVAFARNLRLLVWDSKTFRQVRQIEVQRSSSVTAPSLGPNASCFYWFDKGASGFRRFDIRSGEVLGEHSFQGFRGKSISFVPVPGTSALAWTTMADRDAYGTVLHLARFTTGQSDGFSFAFQALPGSRNSAVAIAGQRAGVVYGDPEKVHYFNLQGEGKNANWVSRRVAKADFQNEPLQLRRVLRDVLQPRVSGESQLLDSSKPRLFVFAVGIDQYEFSEHNLNYSVADARALTARFQAERGRLFRDVQVKLCADSNATPARILAALDWLQQSCSEDDLAIVYFSGHGFRANRGLYYLSHLGDEENIQNTCVNWSDVAAPLSRTKAKQILFLSDCCHAGSFSKDRYLNQHDLADAIAKSDNLAIFASSSREEVSFELEKLRHGAFTYAILEALNGAADTDGNGSVDWNELVAFTTARVVKLTDGGQNPTVLKPVRPDVNLTLSTTAASKSTASEAVSP